MKRLVDIFELSRATDQRGECHGDLRTCERIGRHVVVWPGRTDRALHVLTWMRVRLLDVSRVVARSSVKEPPLFSPTAATSISSIWAWSRTTADSSSVAAGFRR